MISVFFAPAKVTVTSVVYYGFGFQSHTKAFPYILQYTSIPSSCTSILCMERECIGLPAMFHRLDGYMPPPSGSFPYLALALARRYLVKESLRSIKKTRSSYSAT